MKTIYLAGPMLDCSSTEMKDWRQEVIHHLQGFYNFLDPVKIEADPKDFKTLVEGDLEAIHKCDIVLANCWKASPGTAQELVYARTIFKKLTWVVNGINSPWLEYHGVNCFKTLEQAISSLEHYALIDIEK